MTLAAPPEQSPALLAPWCIPNSQDRRPELMRVAAALLVQAFALASRVLVGVEPDSCLTPFK